MSSVPSLRRRRFSLQEYYRIERGAEEKSDWCDGEIYNMSGGTTNHSRIKSNLMRELGVQLKGKPCEPLDNDQRLRIPGTELCTYPDAAVYCDPIEYDPDDDQRHTATNPTAIFEVLSDSTESYDRGIKAERYHLLPSLRAYVLISQNAPRVEIFERQDDGSWLFRDIRGLEASLRVNSIGVTLSFAELYHRVEFPVQATA
jgi:Uma2 family endonuclease